MTKEEIEELKKDPVKFIKTLTKKEFSPYQETFLSLLYRNSKENITTLYNPYRAQKTFIHDIATQRQLLLMKEKEVFSIITPAGKVTFLCVENTTGIK